jgi:hypothetical protein
MKRVSLVLLLLATALTATCARETGEPDPPQQVLVPCDPSAPDGDPLACPPADAGVDAPPDARRDAARDAAADAAVDASAVD